MPKKCSKLEELKRIFDRNFAITFEILINFAELSELTNASSLLWATAWLSLVKQMFREMFTVDNSALTNQKIDVAAIDKRLERANASGKQRNSAEIVGIRGRAIIQQGTTR